MPDNIRPTSGNDQTDTMSEQIWKLYVDQASKEDKETFDGWQSDMDSLLIFAALFSAVLTAFVIESYKGLLPDGGDSSAQILGQILMVIQSNSSSPTTLSVRSSASSNAVFVNTLWFMSLVFSLSTALLAILAKQWIRNLTIGISPSPVEGGRQRQFRHDGLVKWKLPSLITMFPVLLQFSLLLFFAGLAGFLWPINHIVAAITTGLVAISGSLYVMTHLLPLLYASCPYKTPFTFILDDSLPRVKKVIAILYHSLALAYVILGGSCKYLWQVVWSYTASDKKSEQIHLKIEKPLHDLRDAWYRSITVSPGSRMEMSQEQCINNTQSEVDKKSLMWLVERSTISEDVSPLVQHISQSDHLFALQNNLIEANAVRLLIRYLHSAHNNHNRTQTRRDQLIRYSRTLVQLVTEVKESDLPPVVVEKNGPRFPDHVNHLNRAIDSVWMAARSDPHSPIARPIIFTVEDMVFCTNLLRLQVALHRKKKLGFHLDISSFYRTLQNWYTIDGISAQAHCAAINTITFIGTYDGDSMTKSVESTSELEQLTRYLRNAKQLSFEVRWQICWGVYALSQEYYWSSFLPAPQLTLIHNLQGFFQLLSVDTKPQSLRAVLACISGILFSGLDVELSSEITEVTTERSNLTFINFGREIVKMYPRFLTIYVRRATKPKAAPPLIYDITAELVKISCLLIRFARSRETALGNDIFRSWDLKNHKAAPLPGMNMVSVSKLNQEDASKPNVDFINVVSYTLHLLEHLSKTSKFDDGKFRQFICAAVGWIALNILSSNIIDSVDKLINYNVDKLALEDDIDSNDIAECFKQIFALIKEQGNTSSLILGRDIMNALHSVLMDIFRAADDEYTVALRNAFLQESLADLLPAEKPYSELKRVMEGASQIKADFDANPQPQAATVEGPSIPEDIRGYQNGQAGDETKDQNPPNADPHRIGLSWFTLWDNNRSSDPAGSAPRHGRVGRVPPEETMRGRRSPSPIARISDRVLARRALSADSAKQRSRPHTDSYRRGTDS